jgi:hypothetical protein
MADGMIRRAAYARVARNTRLWAHRRAIRWGDEGSTTVTQDRLSTQFSALTSPDHCCSKLIARVRFPSPALITKAQVDRWIRCLGLMFSRFVGLCVP